MFFYTRYPSSNMLKIFFSDVKVRLSFVIKFRDLADWGGGGARVKTFLAMVPQNPPLTPGGHATEPIRGRGGEQIGILLQSGTQTGFSAESDDADRKRRKNLRISQSGVSFFVLPLLCKRVCVRVFVT